MIEFSDNVAWALFGTGDIAFCGCDEQDGSGRNYLAFQSHAPGAIGHEGDVDREFPIKDGWVPGSQAPCMVFEFQNVESIDSVIDGLIAHRATRFPTAAPRVSGGPLQYWSHGFENGSFEHHDTEAEARASAREWLQIARDRSGDSEVGWPEETGQISWGTVVESALVTVDEPWPEDDGPFARHIEHELRPLSKAQKEDSKDA
jgi:hypothetical protein